jgi:hypothetical protein
MSTCTLQIAPFEGPADSFDYVKLKPLRSHQSVKKGLLKSGQPVAGQTYNAGRNPIVYGKQLDEFLNAQETRQLALVCTLGARRAL